MIPFPPERAAILAEALKELGFGNYTRSYFSLPPIPPADSGCKRKVCLQHGITAPLLPSRLDEVQE